MKDEKTSWQEKHFICRRDRGKIMKTVMCFGDSNTYGYIPGSGKRYAWSQRWTSLLQEKFDDEYFAGKAAEKVRIIEEGLVGRTSIFEDPLRQGRNGSALLPTLLETHAPLDNVVLMLGTNDCKTVYGASAERIGKGIEKLICQIKQVTPDAKILLMSPIHLGAEVWKEEFDPEFNQNSVAVSKNLKRVYQKIAAKYGCDFLAASDVAEPSLEDQEHMTVKGHADLAEAISETLHTSGLFDQKVKMRLVG